MALSSEMRDIAIPVTGLSHVLNREKKNKSIGVNVLPKGSKFNQLYFVDCAFPDVKNTNQSCNGQKSESKSTFWAPMDN
jgi:hypothetical protein